MVTPGNILYSAAAVRRMLGLSKSAQVTICEFFKVVWVWVKGQRPTFISKRLFKQHFAEWRKAQSRALQVTQRLDRPNTYTVRNESKGSTYILETRSDGVFCTCDDFNNQLEFWGRGCCKHGYAVLAHLGLGSLRDYMTARKVIPLRRASEPAAIYAA